MTAQRISPAKLLIIIWTVTVLIFLYVPMFSVVLASLTKKRYFSFPVQGWDTIWYEKALQSLSVRDLIATPDNPVRTP